MKRVLSSSFISVTDPKVAAALSGAAHAEGLRVNFWPSAEAARTLITKDPPSPAIIDRDIPLVAYRVGRVRTALVVA